MTGPDPPSSRFHKGKALQRRNRNQNWARTYEVEVASLSVGTVISFRILLLTYKRFHQQMVA